MGTKLQVIFRLISKWDFAYFIAFKCLECNNVSVRPNLLGKRGLLWALLKKSGNLEIPFFAGVYVWAFFNDGENNFPGNIPNTARHFELHHQPPPRKKIHISFNRYFDVFSLTEFEAKKNIGRFIDF